MELGEAIENANRQLVDGNDAGMFVTAWVGVLDYATGHVKFVNAGHNPPLLWQFESDGLGKWRWLTEKSGMPLGLFDGFPCETFSLDCGPGDTFLLYTDGVTEAMSASGELYGEDRLEALVRDAFALHPRELVMRVRHDVADYAQGAEQSDDITVLSLEVGVPYDPLAKPDAATADEYAGIADIPIGGLGILMAKRSVDEMRYERTDGLNVVTFVKRW